MVRLLEELGIDKGGWGMVVYMGGMGKAARNNGPAVYA